MNKGEEQPERSRDVKAEGLNLEMQQFEQGAVGGVGETFQAEPLEEVDMEMARVEAEMKALEEEEEKLMKSNKLAEMHEGITLFHEILGNYSHQTIAGQI